MKGGEEPRRTPVEPARPRTDPVLEEELALVELVSRVLDKGAVIAGDVVISVAGIDLIHLGLNLYLCSAETARATGIAPMRHPQPRPTDEEG